MALPLKMLCRSLIQRIPRTRRRGLTDYFTTSISGRIESSKRQLEKHGHSNQLIEIGCGQDLHTSLCAALLFGKKVIAFDVEALADIALINFTLAQLKSSVRVERVEQLREIGVDYVVAPDIGGIDGFDGVVSTAAFEHIPPEQLAFIFTKIRNTLPASGTCTALIDYADHWSYVESVRPDNFYYIGESAWKVLNNRSMYQNRLRHCDMLELASAADLRADNAALSYFSDDLLRPKLTARFREYDAPELLVSTALVTWKRG